MGEGFRQLLVWQRAMELVVGTYAASQQFPREERYGITAQLRSSAVSVPANIAEVKARGGAGEFQHFLNIARGSLAELEMLVELSRRLGYLSDAVAASITTSAHEIGRMISGLKAAIAAS